MAAKSPKTLSSCEKKKPAVLPYKLEKKLLAYVIAGAGLLSVAFPADAEVVYTPSNIPIPDNRGVANLDLNNDGIVDFTFTNSYHFTRSASSAFLRVHPGQAANQIFSFVSNGKVTAAALPDGYQIGSSGQFKPDGTFLNLFGEHDRSSYGGLWGKVEYAYLGLKFVINGETHFGWARVKYDSPGDIYNASIYGYAYETIANKPIIAGQTSGAAPEKFQGSNATAASTETATLGFLASGTRGIGILRKNSLNQR